VTGACSDPLTRLLAHLEDELPRARELRRALHAAPELGHEEHATSAVVAGALAGAEVTPVAGTGLVARVGVGRAGVVVRAELDGLPVHEATGAPFAADTGTMHACGHDVHMAALVALVAAARRMEAELPAPLVALFQPAEELYPSGAQLVVGEGALDGARAVVGAHVHPDLPWGSVGVEAGAVNAAADTFRIVVDGLGGHAAYPHQTRDPVLAICAVVQALQQVVSRRIDPTHAAVVTVGALRAGQAENVVPGTAEAFGTLRTLDEADREPARAAVSEVAAGVAAAYGCGARVEFTEGEPATVNDAALAAAVAALARESGLRLAPALRSCGSDDFGYFGAVAPSLLVFVGLLGRGPHLPLHHPAFLPPDDAVDAVARVQAIAYLACARDAASTA